MVEWKEREHDSMDALAIEDEDCMDTLRNCGLKTFFLMPYVWAQPELLQYLINLWDENDQLFQLRDQVLELDVSDVYFIIGLSWRGMMPILTGSRPFGENMGEVMERVCPGARYGTGSAKVDITTVQDLTLKAVLFTITWVVGSQVPHEATKNHLILVAKCLNTTLFYWATAVTTNIKRQLTKCKQGKQKQFGYGSILVSFFLEWLPIFQGQGAMVVDQVPREPRMARWAVLMPRGGGG